MYSIADFPTQNHRSSRCCKYNGNGSEPRSCTGCKVGDARCSRQGRQDMRWNKFASRRPKEDSILEIKLLLFCIDAGSGIV
jgi:hypothetical protein